MVLSKQIQINMYQCCCTYTYIHISLWYSEFEAWKPLLLYHTLTHPLWIQGVRVGEPTISMQWIFGNNNNDMQGSWGLWPCRCWGFNCKHRMWGKVTGTKEHERVASRLFILWCVCSIARLFMSDVSNLFDCKVWEGNSDWVDFSVHCNFWNVKLNERLRLSL